VVSLVVSSVIEEEVAVVCTVDVVNIPGADPTALAGPTKIDDPQTEYGQYCITLPIEAGANKADTSSAPIAVDA
jgi:hypothetical protein